MRRQAVVTVIAAGSGVPEEALHFGVPGGNAASLENSPPFLPAVFLDRDGTLMEDADYCCDPARVSVYPDAARALRSLQAHGFRTVMVTNQSGIGRGLFTEDDFQRVQLEMLRQLGDRSLLDAVYYCPDHPDTSTARRKPGAGMLLEAARAHHLDLARSYMIGDSDRDIEAGRRAGVAASILVLTGKGREHLPRCHPDFAAETLSQAAAWILQHADTRHHG